MQKKRHEILKAVTMISQFGINMIVPILLCTFIANYVKDKFFPNHKYIVLIGVIVGAASSVSSMMKMIKAMSGAKKDE